MTQPEYRHDRFLDDFREAIQISGNPSTEELRELVSAIKENPDHIPEDQRQIAVTGFIRSGMHQMKLPEEWFSDAILTQVSDTREKIANQFDNPSLINQRFLNLKEAGHVYIDRFSDIFNKQQYEPTAQLSFRKAFAELRKLPQMIALHDIQEVHFKLEGAMQGYGTGTIQTVRKAYIEVKLKIAGTFHPIRITLEKEDLAAFQDIMFPSEEDD